MPLQSIGGGLEMLKVESPKDVLEQYKSIFGLAELAAKLQKSPYELSQAQSEAAIKGNEARPENIGLSNLMKLAQTQEAVHKAQPAVMAMHDALQNAELVTKQGTEQRAKADFIFKGLGSLPAAFGQNFEMGKQYLKTLVPGAQAVENPDGTFSVGIPQPTGELAVIPLDPRKVGDPEKVHALEEKMRDGWTKIGQGYATVDEFYRNFKTTNSLPVPTGPGDVAVLFSYMKMLDRNTAVREGQFAEAKDAPNVPQSILNQYNRAVQSGGPVLGDRDSVTRRGFNEAAEAIYKNSRDDALNYARFYGTVAKNGGGDAKNVLIPFGGLGYDAVFGGEKSVQSLTGGEKPAPGRAEPQTTPAGLPAPGKPRPQPGEASMLPSSTEPAPRNAPAGEAPARVEDTLKNLFTLPPGGP